MTARDFNADAVIWNLDRYFKNDSPQFEPPGAGIIARARAAHGQLQEDRRRHRLRSPPRSAASYFPYMVVYLLFTSPASFEKAGRDWAKVAALPAAGTGPFRITRVVPRAGGRPGAHDGYWDPDRKAKVDKVRLMPIPEANARLAALRSGQVDWIEVPPPDGIPSLKAAGFAITTGSYPHVWPWFFNIGAEDSPLKDVRVRQALNYCIDRAGIVGVAERHRRAGRRLAQGQRPDFGKPKNRYTFDPAKGKALLAEAGYTPAEAADLQGDDLDLGLGPDAAAADERVPAGEPQAGLRRRRGLQRGRMAGAAERQPRAARRARASRAPWRSTSARPRRTPASWRATSRPTNFSPNGFNFEHWKDEEFDAALKTLAESTDPTAISTADRKPPTSGWSTIRPGSSSSTTSTPARCAKKVQGFVSPQSWFVDLTLVSVQ